MNDPGKTSYEQELEDDLGKLELARNQLRAERDAQKMRAENLLAQRDRINEHNHRLQQELSDASTRACYLHTVRIENQAKALRDLQARYNERLAALDGFRTGAEQRTLRAKLLTKNQVVTAALQRADEAMAECRKAKHEAHEAKLKNNAECLAELQRQMRQNTAQQETIKQLREQAVTHAREWEGIVDRRDRELDSQAVRIADLEVRLRPYEPVRVPWTLRVESKSDGKHDIITRGPVPDETVKRVADLLRGELK